MAAQFEQFNLQPFLINAVKQLGFKEPTPVQAKVIPFIQKGRSVVGQSQTGSGKTHAFLLPLVDKIDPAKDEVQVVITAPSRELATQIYQAAKQLVADAPQTIRVQNFVGGTDKKRQMQKLQSSQPHIVIGTPGRILDLMKENALKIYTANYFVVDEADMTLDMGFLSEVDKIAAALPKNLQMMVFSATIPEKLRPFLKKYMENPVVEEIPAQAVISDTVANFLIATKNQDKNPLIYELLTIGQPYLAMVFANTKQKVDEITEYLREQGLKVAKLHGDVPPRERKRIMKQIQNLDFQYVVATDLAARGIDIEGVSHVINAEIPEDLEFFIHRVGRTGRNGLPGTAITLYETQDEKIIAEIENLGVVFQPKTIQKGEIVDTYDRNRRNKRKKTNSQTLDTEMIGLVKKKKKKIKPGYKKQLSRAINEKARKQRQVERRAENRAARKAKKEKNQY